MLPNSEDRTQVDQRERLRLLRDGVANNLNTVASAVVGIVTVPWMLVRLGPESYGLWAICLSISGVFAVLELGLGRALVRDIAAAQASDREPETARFGEVASKLFLLLGVIGGVAIACVGFVVGRYVQLSPGNLEIAPKLFLVAGITFVTDRLFSFAIYSLHGLRRFGAAGGLSLLATLFKAAGLLIPLFLWGGLLYVGVGQTIASACAASLALTVIASSGRQLGIRGGVRLDALRPHVHFVVSSQVNALAGKALWEIPLLSVGVVFGPQWSALYNVAQKFPVTLAGIIWGAAQVFYPAGADLGRDITYKKALLTFGTRWLAIFAVPACLILWVLAPELLTIWIGGAHSETVVLFRLITIAVGIESVAAPAIELLWGAGRSREVLVILASMLGTSVLLTPVLLLTLGAEGAAWALLIAVCVGSTATLFMACTTAESAAKVLLVEVFHGLFLASVVCCAATYAAVRLIGPGGWPGLMFCASAGVIAYVVLLYSRGISAQEKLLTRSIFTSQLRPLAAFVCLVRRGFARISPRGRRRL